jgi:hypothetical protein
MEIMGESQIYGKIRGLARKYFQERNDNMVLSFGLTGYSILKDIKPLQVRKTVYKSIQFRNERAFIKPSHKEGGELVIEGPEDMHVSILSKEEMEYRKKIDEYETWANPLESASVSIEYVETGDNVSLVARQIFESMEKTNTILLVSEFGNEFVQALHAEMIKLVESKNIPNYSYIIKPAKTSGTRRKMAEAGIQEIRKITNHVSTFDVQTVSEKLRMDGFPRISIPEKINERIARKVEVLSAKMSNASELLKYQLSA